jgi:hypothetical protein
VLGFSDSDSWEGMMPDKVQSCWQTACNSWKKTGFSHGLTPAAICQSLFDLLYLFFLFLFFSADTITLFDLFMYLSLYQGLSNTVG